MKTRLVVATLLTLSLVSMGLAAANGAASPTTTYVTLYGNGGNAVAGSNAWLWQASPQLTVKWGANGQVDVYVSDAADDNFSITFAPPPGQSLTTGTYLNAQRAPFQDSGRPGIDVSGNGRGCDTETGSFTINSIAPDLSTFSVDYQADCEGNPASRSQGEIRYQVDPSKVSIVPVARTAYFPPTTDGGASNATTTLYNLATGPVTISSATVTSGSDAFHVRPYNCGTLAVGTHCAIGLSFKPTTAGPISGVLTLADTTGRTYLVNLQGTGVPTLKVSAAARVYGYGAVVTVTARLRGGSPTSNVSMARTSGTSTIPMGTKVAGSTGTVRFGAVVTTRTTFVATWNDGTNTIRGSLAINVHAKAAIAEYGARARVGAYWLFVRGRNIVTRAAVAPNKAGQCLSMTAQYWSGSAWRTFSTLPCVALNSSSRAAAYLQFSTFTRAHLWRFHASYAGDSTNLAATSGWLYARWG